MKQASTKVERLEPRGFRNRRGRTARKTMSDLGQEVYIEEIGMYGGCEFM